MQQCLIELAIGFVELVQKKKKCRGKTFVQIDYHTCWRYVCKLQHISCLKYAFTVKIAPS